MFQKFTIIKEEENNQEIDGYIKLNNILMILSHNLGTQIVFNSDNKYFVIVKESLEEVITILGENSEKIQG